MNNKQQLKNPSDEIIKKTRKRIPYPAAFYEIAVAIRKDIKTKRKEGSQYDNLLKKLYQYAVIENFFRGIEWNKIITEKNTPFYCTFLYKRH